jgi:Cysteine-rich secretory protein family
MPTLFSRPGSSLLERLRRTGRRTAIASVLLGMIAADASADAVLHVPCSLDASEILQLHNAHRDSVGVPPLRWSDSLAAGAQHWASELAARNQMVHSHTPGVGENIAMWWGHHPSLDTMIDMWTAEKQYFRRGTFPAVSQTGDWESVAHYSQMVWRETTEVGCGVADNGRTEYLVCWYNPQGNFFGKTPY